MIANSVTKREVDLYLALEECKRLLIKEQKSSHHQGWRYKLWLDQERAKTLKAVTALLDLRAKALDFCDKEENDK